MRSFVPFLFLGVAACQSSNNPTPDSPTSSSAQSATTAPVPSPSVATDSTSKPDPKPVGPPAAMPASVSKLAAASNAFGYDMFGKVGPGNVAISPASITIALSMTLGGAKAETAAQMKKTMHLDGDGADWGKISAALQAPNRPVELHIANRLFLEKTYKLEDAFTKKTQDAFGAPAELVDFKNDKNGARLKINGWVSDQTKTKIKDLVPEGGVTPDSRLALVNAIYFLGEWEEPFTEQFTNQEDFSLAPGKTKKVSMMHHTEHFKSNTWNGTHVVQLPYKGNEMSMTIIVPDKADGLPAFEKTLSTDSIQKMDAVLSSQMTSVSMPKFTIDPAASFELGAALQGLGMKDAFDKEHADFTAMANPPSPAERLYIAKVFHKAFVKVDEKGTEAAGATAVMMAKAGGAPQQPFEVKIDKPFLFLIRDKNGIVLFMGRVTDPKS